jgi:hypothetical protein
VLRVVAGKWGSGLLGSRIALRDVKPPPRIFFDLSNQRQADISMQTLHKPLLDQGVAFWWVDGGSGAVDMPGLDKQLWTNKVFYDATEQARPASAVSFSAATATGAANAIRGTSPATPIQSGRCWPTKSRTAREPATCWCRT